MQYIDLYETRKKKVIIWNKMLLVFNQEVTENVSSSLKIFKTFSRKNGYIATIS